MSYTKFGCHESINIDKFVPVFDNRMKDTCVSHWQTCINQNTCMTLYPYLKLNSEKEQYLTILENLRQLYIQSTL